MTESRLPENKYLKTLLACITRRCAILGLDAATRIKQGGEIGAMTEAEKRELIHNLAAKLAAMENDRQLEDEGGEDAGRVAGAGEPRADLGPGGPEPDASG